MKHHPYNGIQDFITMTAILAVGRKTTQRPYYVHTGDLSWWMFYSDHDDAHWQKHVTLWEQDSKTCGWSLVDPDWCSFDVYLLPEINDSKVAAYILDWTIHQITEIVHEQNGEAIRTMWVSEHDQDHIDRLTKRGFILDEGYMWYMERSLNINLPEVNLPNHYRIRNIQGEGEIHRRAAAAYNAFRSSRHFEEYWSRYQRFMRSPVYNPAFDLVTESPEGEFASFCIVWPDPINHIGLFEPVGTHTEFQRKGLAKAVITAGLRSLKNWGMNRAMVCAEYNNAAALQLYQSVGFEIKHKLLTYIKSI